MTQKEDKELLLSLLNKANDNDLLHVYDYDENLYSIDWMFIDDAKDKKICIKLKKF